MIARQASSVVVIGGGPGGYEAALVARRLGAQVTVVDSDGLGGSCVLTDCVPSKSLISTAHVVPVSYTHLRAHETVLDIVCRLLLNKKKHTNNYHNCISVYSIHKV